MRRRVLIAMAAVFVVHGALFTLLDWCSHHASPATSLRAIWAVSYLEAPVRPLTDAVQGLLVSSVEHEGFRKTLTLWVLSVLGMALFDNLLFVIPGGVFYASLAGLVVAIYSRLTRDSGGEGRAAPV